LFIKATELST